MSSATTSGAGEPLPVAARYTPGNEADFDRLYRTSYHRVLFTLTGMLRNRAAAEDCTQEAFVKAYKAWSTWEPVAPAEAWVHRIALNLAVSYLRAQKLREVGEVLRRFGRPATQAPSREGANELLDALHRIPEKDATVVILRHHHGYTNREIAHALGIPESTVASRLASAKAKLRKQLGDSAGEPGEGRSDQVLGEMVRTDASDVPVSEASSGASQGEPQ